MILWCTKCGEYRKRNSPEWDECRYTNHHPMVAAHEKFNNEIDGLRRRIAEAEDAAAKDAKPDDTEVADTGTDDARRRLGTLEAIKNTVVDDRLSSETVPAVVEDITHDCLYDEHGGTFFWIGGDGKWDLLRHDSKALESAVSAVHARRYGEAGRSFGVRDAIEAHADVMRLDRSKRAVAAGRRAVFADGMLWIDLGGDARTVYSISADGHGPAVRYKPGARFILERHGEQLPGPRRREGRWLERFCGLLRIEQEQRRTFAAHVCHMLCTHVETPAMMLDAGDGDAALRAGVTAARLVRELVDPVGFRRGVAMAPTGVHQLERALESPVVAFGYADQLQRDVARCLAAAREGMPLSNGRLYGHARVIFAGSANSTGPLIRYGVEAAPGPDTPEDMLAALDCMKPHLLYEVFDVVHGAFGRAAARRAGPATVSFDDVAGAIQDMVDGQ